VPKCWDEVVSRAELATKQRECRDFNLANKYKKRGVAALPVKFGISFTAQFLNQGAALVIIYK
jgi:xanthine dehydrogenase/oxidase